MCICTDAPDDLFIDLLGLYTEGCQKLSCHAVALPEDTDQQMFGPDRICLKALGLSVADVKDPSASRRILLRLCHAQAAAPDQLADQIHDLLFCYALICQHLACQAFLLTQQADQDMFCSYIIMIQFHCCLPGMPDDIGSHLGKSVLHVVFLLSENRHVF